MLLSKLSLLLTAGVARATNIVVSNDDGWATANIRVLYSTLKGGGHKTLISAPANNKSGSGSQTAEPTPLEGPGQFNTIPAGAPATGSDASDPNIFYVNSYPATSMEYGIKTFAPQVFEGPVDFAVSGINVGGTCELWTKYFVGADGPNTNGLNPPIVNLGSTTQISGTVGAAALAVQLGVPAIAFSGAGSSQHIYTEPDPASNVYGQVALKLVNTVIASGTPYLPEGVALNVNFPFANSNTCSQVSDYSFVLTRIYTDSSATDVEQCGTTHLPTERSVFNRGGCRVPISMFDASTKRDVGRDKQTVVRDKIASLLSCI